MKAYEGKMVFNLESDFNLKSKREISMRQEVEQMVVNDRDWLPSENMMKKAVPSVN